MLTERLKRMSRARGRWKEVFKRAVRVTNKSVKRLVIAMRNSRMAFREMVEGLRKARYECVGERPFARQPSDRGRLIEAERRRKGATVECRDHVLRMRSKVDFGTFLPPRH